MVVHPRSTTVTYMKEVLAGDRYKQHIYQEKLAKAKKLRSSKPIPKRSKKQAVKEKALAKIKREMWDGYDFHICPLCDVWIREFPDCEIDHIKPRGMGGGKA